MSRLALLLAVCLVLAAAPGAAREGSWLGVRIRDMSEQEMEELSKRHGIREGFGVVIVEVMAGTPAERAGVKPGDIVVAFEGRPVTETRMLQRMIAAAPAEQESRLTVLRAEGRRALAVRLVEMPRVVAGDRVAGDLGIVLREPEAGAGDPGRPASAGGPPSVSFVLRDSAAERAGVEVGDILVQVGDTAVVSRDAAREAFAGLAAAQPLRLTVRRGGRLVSLDIGPVAR